jgi:hypothetical protein
VATASESRGHRTQNRTRRGRDRQWPCPQTGRGKCACRGQCSTVAHPLQHPGATIYHPGSLPQTHYIVQNTAARWVFAGFLIAAPVVDLQLHFAGIGLAWLAALADLPFSALSVHSSSVLCTLALTYLYFYAAAPPRRHYFLALSLSFASSHSSGSLLLPPSLSSSTVSWFLFSVPPHFPERLLRPVLFPLWPSRIASAPSFGNPAVVSGRR